MKKQLNQKELAALKMIHGTVGAALNLVLMPCENFTKQSNINMAPLEQIRISVKVIKESLKAGAGLLTDEEIKKLKDG